MPYFQKLVGMPILVPSYVCFGHFYPLCGLKRSPGTMIAEKILQNIPIPIPTYLPTYLSTYQVASPIIKIAYWTV